MIVKKCNKLQFHVGKFVLTVLTLFFPVLLDEIKEVKSSWVDF